MDLKLTFVLVSLSALLGCSGGPAATDDTGSTDPGSEEAVLIATSPLYITLETQYDGDDNDGTSVENHGICNIDPDNLAANNINCTVTIPEGRLFYSNLTLNWGTGRPDLCPRIEFFPYYRKLSTSAAYVPAGLINDVDCTDSTVVACYGGAALDIVPNFPINTGLWFPTDKVTNITKVVNSAWSLDSRYGNLHTCNNLSAAGRLADVTVGGTQQYESTWGFQDYLLKCVDPHQGTLFTITMIIEDEDTDASDTDLGNDEFYDWN